MKKLIKVLLVLGMILMCGCQQQQKDDIHIFFTSDVHCGVEENLGLASVKALVDEAKSNYPYVTLVDTGDFIQGGTLGTLSKGKVIIEIMNDMEYDLVTIGNHEFDFGTEELGKRLEEMNFEVVVTNARYNGSGTSVFENVPEYVIKDYGGTKVGFIGVLTPTTITDSTPKYFMEGDEFVYDFYYGNNGQDLYDRVQEAVDELRGKGVKYVVALSHLGSNAFDAPFDSISLIANTTGIDAVLDGHSHSRIINDLYPNKNGEDVVLSSVGTKTQALGELILGKDGSLSIVQYEEYDKKDEKIVESIAKANSEIEEILSQKVCDLDFDLPITDEDGIRMVRSRETTAADFVADAFRYTFGADIAMINGGGVRSSIEAGEVTYGDLLMVAPFQNSSALVCATGQQILDALEFGASKTEKLYKFDGNATGENGAFLQVSGLKYTIDTSVGSPVIIDDNGFLDGFSDGKRRVKDVYVLEGEEYVPIDPEKTYLVASINYILFNNGDGNTAFKDAEEVIENGITDVEILYQYLCDVGSFSDSYRQTEGRITVK
ncbi:MAG: bifunctional metallophosphatase/5'-nucleotidase [Erysipelotrichaceae bacterium]|nr:bifunctional metallophosphatase/5'-nucleotidase [Erysipelotrichaceae bacterium]